MQRAPSIAAPPFPVQALGCVAMALVCDLCGLLHTEAPAPSTLWPGAPICHTGGVGWVSGFGAGLTMGFVMMLVSLAPLRWTGIASIAGAVTALLWVLGAGVLQALILAADQIAPMVGGALPSAIPRLILLAIGMAAALHTHGCAGGTVKRLAFHDGAHCFLRCAPMMIAMMLTGAMSLPWVIAGALLTQIDATIGDPRASRLLTCGIGLVAVVATVRIV